MNQFLQLLPTLVFGAVTFEAGRHIMRKDRLGYSLLLSAALLMILSTLLIPALPSHGLLHHSSSRGG
jgi:hypothetical protein